MDQRLEDFWPNLLSQNTDNDQQSSEATQNLQEDNNLEQNDPDLLVQNMIEQYKNLYWTRIISADNFDIDDEKKWRIGYDIADEIQQMMDIDENDLPEWSPLWDPTVFTEQHPKPKVVDF